MTIYDFSAKDKDGVQQSLAQYKGKVLMIINSATECGFTPQYKDLEADYELYHEKGFEILDFPCNQFGNQAPGSEEEIHNFCTTRFGVKFPLMAKVEVNGANQEPVFAYLKEQKGFEGFGKGIKAGIMDKLLRKGDKDYASKSDIKWNFTKFLVDRSGKVVARFEPTADMKEVRKQIEALL